MEGDTRNVFLFDFVDVFFVLAAEDNLFDSGSLGGEDFFTDAAYRKDFAAQGDLSGHSKSFFHFSSGQ